MRLCLRLLCLVLPPVFFACSPAEKEPSGRLSVLDFADPMVQTMMAGGYNSGDYEAFSKHFDSRLKQQLTPPAFLATRDTMFGMVGRFVAARVDSLKPDGAYRVVYYRVRFDNDAASSLKVILLPYFDSYLVSGIEFSGGSLSP